MVVSVMIHVRRATIEDAETILEWRNDPLAIEMSKTRKAVSLAEHLDWFARAIASPSHHIIIALENERPLGVVRFSRQEAEWLVSINLAPAERGRSLAARILKKSIAAAGVTQLAAEIKNTNVASIRLFEKCGFKLVGNDGQFQRWTLASPSDGTTLLNQ